MGVPHQEEEDIDYPQGRLLQCAEQPHEHPHGSLVFRLLACVVCANGPMLWQVALFHGNLVQVHQEAAALHLRPMRAIIQHRAHMM